MVKGMSVRDQLGYPFAMDDLSYLGLSFVSRGR